MFTSDEIPGTPAAEAACARSTLIHGFPLSDGILLVSASGSFTYMVVRFMTSSMWSVLEPSTWVIWGLEPRFMSRTSAPL